MKPVVRTSISDDIVDQILSLISSGKLKPGQRLPPERDLCKTFGAGRSSVREALRCLCIVGVLSARAGEGTSVVGDGGKLFGKILKWKVLTEQQDIEDMLELRIALEGLTAASAAMKGSLADFERLDALVDSMKDATEEEERFTALDLGFHLAIAQASSNRLILDLIAVIRAEFEKTVSRVLHLPDALPLSHCEHVAILKALKTHDPEAARSAMQSHLEAAMKRYHTAVGAGTGAVAVDAIPVRAATKSKASRFGVHAANKTRKGRARPKPIETV